MKRNNQKQWNKISQFDEVCLFTEEVTAKSQVECMKKNYIGHVVQKSY